MGWRPGPDTSENLLFGRSRSETLLPRDIRSLRGNLPNHAPRRRMSPIPAGGDLSGRPTTPSSRITPRADTANGVSGRAGTVRLASIYWCLTKQRESVTREESPCLARFDQCQSGYNPAQSYPSSHPTHRRSRHCLSPAMRTVVASLYAAPDTTAMGSAIAAAA
jgi:hypothetical protein